MRIVWAFLLGLLVMTAGATGCETRETASNLQQEARGLGIVQGTLGILRAASVPPRASVMMRGQVLELEGGAYVARSSSGEEVRVPLDENTSADRPAHVGDHIEVYFDAGHRAIQIRNIDSKIAL
jgi:hypothetical protein